MSGWNAEMNWKKVFVFCHDTTASPAQLSFFFFFECVCVCMPTPTRRLQGSPAESILDVTISRVRGRKEAHLSVNKRTRPHADTQCNEDTQTEKRGGENDIDIN